MEESKNNMVYRYLGNSGIKVSVLGYGNWLTAHDPKSEQDVIDCVVESHKHGVNFFDTAEIYGAGVAEDIMGKAIKQLNVPRDELVITTKLVKCGNGVNDSMLSRKHLTEGMVASLKRLGLDYVDVIFCHRPDTDVDIEEVCKSMDWLVEEGYAFYWATSEWGPDDIVQAIETCKRLHLHKPIADQCQYNAYVRENVEKNFRKSFEEYRYGTTVWSPLAGGILTGKYNDGVAPEGSRYDKEPTTARIWANFFSEDKKDKTCESLKALAELAAELECTQAELALAWVIVNKDVSTAIFGATKISQVQSNIKAIDIASKWTPELETRIEKILGTQPEPATDFNTFMPKEPRRAVAIDYDFSPPKTSALMAAALKESKTSE
jgi:voltage-dependent potassium channel beta subunit